jgi:adenosylmethionine-8-amino-7-oxononanoate aminotransferase
MEVMSNKNLWLAFSRMEQLLYKTIEVTFIQGKGAYLFDDKGNKYFDGFSTLWTNLVGHGRPEIIEAMTKQLQELSFMHLFTGSQHIPAQKLSEKLIQKNPFNHSRVFFGCAGSDATETAIKLARNYWFSKGMPGKNIIVGRTSTYHGTSMGALSLMGHESYQEPFGPLVDGVHQLPATDYNAFEKYFNEVDAKKNVAAILIEPIITSDGLILPPEGYWKQIQELCRKHDVLILSDEVSTGMGRSGDFYASEMYGLKPDVVYLAKSLTSGYAPLSALMTTEEIYRTINSKGKYFMHGSTFSGHPVSCVAALKVLEIIEKENLVERGKQLASALSTVLNKYLKDLEIVKTINGKGLLYEIELKCTDEKEAELGMTVYKELLNEGQYIRAIGKFLCIAPPLISTEEELVKMAQAIGRVLSKLSNQKGLWR